MQSIQQLLVEEPIAKRRQYEDGPNNPEAVRAMIYGLLLRGRVQWVNFDSAEQMRYLHLIEQGMDQFNAKQLSNIFYALGNMGVKWDDLTPEIQMALPAAIMRNSRDFISQGIAMTISALAKMNLKFRISLSLPPSVSLTVFSADKRQLTYHLMTPVLREALFIAISMTAERLDQQGIANLLWALATMGAIWKDDLSPEIQQKLFDAVLYQSKKFNPQNISNTLWAFAKMTLSWQDLSEHLHKVLLASVLNVADQLNPQNLSNIFSAFAKMTLKWIDFSPTLQAALFKVILMNAGSLDKKTGAFSTQLNAQDSSILLWALAKMKLSWQALPDHAFQQKLLITIARNLSQFNAQNIANTVWAFAEMGLIWNDLEQGNLQHVLADEVGETFAHFQENLEQAISKNRFFFTSQGIGMIFSAFANMKRKWNELTPAFQAVLLAIISTHAERIDRRTGIVCKFDSQGIANTLWALARMGFCLRDFSDRPDLQWKLFFVVWEKSVEFKAQEISNVLWAFATMGFGWHHLVVKEGLQEALLQAVLARATGQSDPDKQFNSQGIANTLWALGKMGLLWCDLTPVLENALLTMISIHALPLNQYVDRFSAAEMAMILDGLAKMGCNWDDLPTALKENLFSLISFYAEVLDEESGAYTQFNSQGISNVLWALATMGLSWESLSENFQQKLVYAILQTLQESKPQEIANTLWSLFVMDAGGATHTLSIPFLSALHDRAILLKLHADLLSVETLSELLLSLEYFWPEEEALISFSSAYEKKSSEDIEWNLTHSKVNQEVDWRLSRAALIGRREYLVSYSLGVSSILPSFSRVIIPLPLDFAFPGCRVGIQIDDPKHTQDIHMKRLDIAHNVLFLRLSEKTGWKIIRIPIVHHSYDGVIEAIQKAIQSVRDQSVQSDLSSQSPSPTESTTASIVRAVTEPAEEHNLEKRKKRTRHHRGQNRQKVKMISGQDANNVLDTSPTETRFPYTFALSCISYVGSFFGRGIKWFISAQLPASEASCKSASVAASS